MSESIVDVCSKPPLIEYEGFIVRPLDGHNLFMENPLGEGTTIRRIEFLVMLQKLFDRNF